MSDHLHIWHSPLGSRGSHAFPGSHTTLAGEDNSSGAGGREVHDPIKEGLEYVSKRLEVLIRRDVEQETMRQKQRDRAGLASGAGGAI